MLYVICDMLCVVYVTWYMLYVICYMLYVICYLLSVISYLLSVMCYMLYVINFIFGNEVLHLSAMLGHCGGEGTRLMGLGEGDSNMANT